MPGAPAGYDGRFDAIGWYLIRWVMRLKRSLPHQPPRLVDLGMGRGRDLIYFARRGFEVEGFDTDGRALAQARRRAASLHVLLPVGGADLRSVRFGRRVDVVFSASALHHLPPFVRPARFAYFRDRTTVGGVHAIAVFRATRGSPPPDADPGAGAFRRGELEGYYRGWELLESSSRTFACEFGGAPHAHAVDLIVARRPAGGARRKP